MKANQFEIITRDLPRKDHATQSQSEKRPAAVEYPCSYSIIIIGRLTIKAVFAMRFEEGQFFQ